MKEIILASASPRRVELLKQVKLDFKAVPSNFDETINEILSIKDLVQSLAYGKANDIAKKLKSDSLVIGADTVVVKDGILGKPNNEGHAYSMLKMLQGEWHEVVTGIAVIDSSSQKFVLGYELTRVKMKQLSDDIINSYIKTGEPMDKAGSYGIQGLGALLVERIEGCYFNVVGLPLLKLSNILEEFGVKIL